MGDKRSLQLQDGGSEGERHSLEKGSGADPSSPPAHRLGPGATVWPAWLLRKAVSFQAGGSAGLHPSIPSASAQVQVCSRAPGRELQVTGGGSQAQGTLGASAPFLRGSRGELLASPAAAATPGVPPISASAFTWPPPPPTPCCLSSGCLL